MKEVMRFTVEQMHHGFKPEKPITLWHWNIERDPYTLDYVFARNAPTGEKT